MRWIRFSAAVLALLLLAVVVRSAEERKVSVYTREGMFALPVIEFERTLYVPLQSLLERLGRVDVKMDRKTARLSLNRIAGEFEDGSPRIRVGRTTLRTAAPVLMHEAKVLVPLNALPVLVKSYAAGEAELHETGRRLFIGPIQQIGSPSIHPENNTLTLEFPNPVNPRITADGNGVRLSFQREPVVMNVDRVDYNDSVIRAVSFNESDGTAEITVEGKAPLLASFSNGGRNITFAIAPAPVAATPTPPETSSPVPVPDAGSNQPAAPATPTPPAPSQSAAPFFIMVDAAHGGDEPGVRFSDKLHEKEVTLALARKLVSELHSRGVPAVLLRTEDERISNEQRAMTANEKHPGVYVSLHAGGPGEGVRVYTALLPLASSTSNPLFVPWDTAQQAFLARSRSIAQSVVNELAAKKISAMMMPAAVAPLNSIAIPAIAIELAPPPGNPSLEALTSNGYQAAVIEAAASGILQTRSKAPVPLGGRK
jgi:N-acetylmuramoyl-L-alanine amidase